MNLPIIIDQDVITYPTRPFAVNNVSSLAGYCQYTEYGFLFADEVRDMAYFNALVKGYDLTQVMSLSGEFDFRNFTLINAKGDIITRTVAPGKKMNTFKEGMSIHPTDMGMKWGLSDNGRIQKFIMAGFNKGMSGVEVSEFLLRNCSLATEFKTEKVEDIVKRLEEKKLGTKMLPAPNSLFMVK